MATRKRDAAKASRWRQRIRAQADSGTSVAAWCRRHRVKQASFYWWRRALSRRDAKRPARAGAARRRASPSVCAKTDPPPSFVPVRVIGEHGSAAAGRIEIVLPGGRRVRLRGPVDRQALADVLAVLTTMPATADAVRRDDAGERRAC